MRAACSGKTPPMKLLSWNVNGIRSVAQKGFLPWLEAQKPDVLCLQEVKAQTDQLTDELLNPLGYHGFWHSAQKKGYSGVSIFTRKEPLGVRYGIGVPEIDDEGRVVSVDFKDFTLVNSYFPNSRRDHSRLPQKLAFCKAILEFLQREKAGQESGPLRRFQHRPQGDRSQKPQNEPGQCWFSPRRTRLDGRVSESGLRGRLP